MSAPLLLLLLATAASEPNVPEPLERYLEAARLNNLTLEIARAQAAQASAQYDQAIGALLPLLAVEGSFTRTQFEATIEAPVVPGAPPREIIITPLYRVAGVATLRVPLVDLGNWARTSAAGHGHTAARRALDATLLDVELAVAQAYYQVVASQGLLAAARRSLTTARANERLARARREAGTETALAVDRARVDTSRAEQNVIAAQRALAVASRNLATLTGLPEPGLLPEPTVPELPSESEERLVALALERRPELARQRSLLEQAQATRREAWSTLAPSISAFARENYSNAPGFIDNRFFWELGFALDWRLDFVTIGTVRLANAAIRAEDLQLERLADEVRDEVHTAWLDVRSNRAVLEVARVESQAAAQALEIAQARFEAGAATSFELSQSQSDAFSAEANLVQAQADLAYSILVLAKASGARLLDDPE